MSYASPTRQGQQFNPFEEIKTLRLMLRKAEFRADQAEFRAAQVESRAQAAYSKVALFEGLLANKTMTLAEKIGTYAIIQAEIEEKKRQEIGAIDASEQRVIKSEAKKLAQAKEQGCSHVYIKRVCNLSGLTRNTVGTLVKKLSIAGYMVLHHVKMWAENSIGADEIHKEMYLCVDPSVVKKPGGIDLSDVPIKKPEKKNVIKLPDFCESCRSPNVEQSGRVVCKSCGEVHIYRFRLSKGKVNGQLLFA